MYYIQKGNREKGKEKMELGGSGWLVEAIGGEGKEGILEMRQGSIVLYHLYDTVGVSKNEERRSGRSALFSLVCGVAFKPCS